MKQLLKSFILILGLFLIIQGTNFAFAEEVTKEQSLKGTADILVLVAQILSRIRIPIANLAGKFMTNSFINGEVFHLSSFLFQCRSIVRVICNFIVVGVVLKIIYDIATSSSKTLTGLGSKVIKLLISVIFINMSRFLIGVMVDISNLAVFGVSNLGYSLINSSPYIKKTLNSQALCIPKTIKYDHKSVQKIYEDGSTGSLINCGTSETPDKSVNRITPTYNDLSGPFMYFGYGVFRFFEYLDIKTIGNGVGSSTSLSSLTISFFVKVFLMAMFLTPLIALLITNAVRVLYIWVRFICSPFIALKRGLKGLGISTFDGIFGFADSNGDFFDIKKIIGAFLTPATVTATLFMSIIIISSMFGSLVGNNPTGLNTPNAGNSTTIQKDLETAQLKATTVQNNLLENGIKINGTKIGFGNNDSVELNGNIVSDATNRVMGSFGYMIICVMTIGLLWTVFKVGLSTSSLLSKLGETIMNKGKQTITQGLRLPVGREGKMISLDQLGNNVLNMNTIDKMFRKNYIDPVVGEQNILVEGTKENILHKLGFDYTKKYTGSTTFNTKVKDVQAQKDTFEKDSITFFDELIGKIREGKNSGMIDKDNYNYTNSIKGRLEKGGVKYLEIDKEDKNKDFNNFFDKKDGKPDLSKPNIAMIMEKSKRLGGFLDNVLSKKFKDDPNGSIKLDDYKDKDNKSKKTFNDIKRKPGDLK